ALATIVEEVAASTADGLAAIPDETLAARAADVRDVGERIARIVTGRVVALPDEPSIADADRVIFEPSTEALARLDGLGREREAAGASARTLRGQPGRTADGHAIALLANIGRVEDVDRALEAGAEGVGLFRTEFLFVGRSTAPCEDAAATAYRQVLAAFGDRPVVIRLLDVGGDKPLPYLRLAP